MYICLSLDVQHYCAETLISKQTVENQFSCMKSPYIQLPPTFCTHDIVTSGVNTQGYRTWHILTGWPIISLSEIDAWTRWPTFCRWHFQMHFLKLNEKFCFGLDFTKVCSWAWGSNYVNPVCFVATVCHQVRCMYLGHLGHFNRAIYHLKWYKWVFVRYLACAFSQMKSINMFSM